MLTFYNLIALTLVYKKSSCCCCCDSRSYCRICEISVSICLFAV